MAAFRMSERRNLVLQRIIGDIGSMRAFQLGSRRAILEIVIDDRRTTQNRCMSANPIRAHRTTIPIAKLVRASRVVLLRARRADFGKHL